jgi:hypothetical protein
LGPETMAAPGGMDSDFEDGEEIEVCGLSFHYA